MAIPKPVDIRPMAPPSPTDVLQPLREIGCDDKTRFWDLEEIQDALRMANLRGIQPEHLFAHNRARSHTRDAG